MFLPTEIIQKKKLGLEHSREEIAFLVNSFTAGDLPEYQMSAWLMAVYFKGLSTQEISFLTEIMMRSGRTIDFSAGFYGTKNLCVDKHSTGGVGDKTSLIIAPLVAAAGVSVPLVAGRGLGHTGGTLDKLESIPGFNVNISIENFREQIARVGTSIIGQTDEFCPADKKIYALRDVTSTVDSIPLICASIMSKKLALGADAIVLDVKFGSGAFMKSLGEARVLAQMLAEIGRRAGRKVSALLTDMSQPLGRFIGNSLEVGECLAIMSGEKFLGENRFDDTVELSLALAAEMIFLGGKAPNTTKAYEIARDLLQDGSALRKFKEFCQAQGGDLNSVKQSSKKYEVRAASSGCVQAFDTEKIGLAALSLGAGRRKVTDVIDHTAGLQVHAKISEEVERGDLLFTVYGENEALFEEAKIMLLSATNISLQKTRSPSLIAERC